MATCFFKKHKYNAVAKVHIQEDRQQKQSIRHLSGRRAVPYGGSSANFHEIQFEGVHLMTTLCEVKMSKTRQQGKDKSRVSVCCLPFAGSCQVDRERFSLS